MLGALLLQADHGMKAPRLPCYAISGLPFYDQLDRLNWSPLRLMLVVTASAILLHLAAFQFTGGFEGSEKMVASIGRYGYLGLFVWMGVLQALYIAGFVIFSRSIQDALVAGLAKRDDSFHERLPILRPPTWARLFNVVLMTVLLLFLLEVGLLRRFNISYTEPGSIIHFGPGPALLFFILYPLAGISFAQFTAPMRYYDQFLQETARRVRIDILRVADYAAIIHPAVIVFITCCLITGLLLVFSEVLQVDEFRTTVNTTLAIFLPIALLGTANLCVPALILRNRFAAAISHEREAVLAALGGDLDALETTHQASDFNRAELLAYLNILDNLKEWPVGPHIQKIILFGLLPPVAWVLAATVENALY